MQFKLNDNADINSSASFVLHIEYSIWRERNDRAHGKQPQTMDKILDQINVVVRVKTSSLSHIASDPINNLLFHSWRLADSNFFLSCICCIVWFCCTTFVHSVNDEPQSHYGDLTMQNIKLKTDENLTNTMQKKKKKISIHRSKNSDVLIKDNQKPAIAHLAVVLSNC